MSKAKWIPGLPTKPGWYVVKDGKNLGYNTIISVDNNLHYWTIGSQFRYPLNGADIIFTHHCLIVFPED